MLLFVLGCGRASSVGIPGVELSPPPAWKPVERTAWMVPGQALAAWSGPQGSSLVAYRTLAGPDSSAGTIVDSLANRLENLPGYQLRERRSETVGGMTAGRVEVIAPGTGDAVAPNGLGTPVATDGKPLLPTRQVTLGFARPDGILYLRWHSPESSYDQIAPDIRKTLDSLRFSAARGPWTSGRPAPRDGESPR